MGSAICFFIVIIGPHTNIVDTMCVRSLDQGIAQDLLASLSVGDFDDFVCKRQPMATVDSGHSCSKPNEPPPIKNLQMGGMNHPQTVFMAAMVSFARTETIVEATVIGGNLGTTCRYRPSQFNTCDVVFWRMRMMRMMMMMRRRRRTRTNDCK